MRWVSPRHRVRGRRGSGDRRPAAVDVAAQSDRIVSYARRTLLGLDPEPVDAVLRLTTTLTDHPGDGFDVWRHAPVVAVAGSKLFKFAPGDERLVRVVIGEARRAVRTATDGDHGPGLPRRRPERVRTACDPPRWGPDPRRDCRPERRQGHRDRHAVRCRRMLVPRRAPTRPSPRGATAHPRCSRLSGSSAGRRGCWPAGTPLGGSSNV